MGATTDRRVRCGELIASGSSVYDAMVKAGFGERFARGSADTFASWLTDRGYMPKAAASKARPGVPAPKADAPDDKE